MSHIEIMRGDGPLVLGVPHTGTDLPDGIAAGLTETGRALADTDWHVHDLYAGLCADATTVRTRVHRYVIDVNRDPAGQSLYPGQNTTSLCPLTDFDGRLLWQEGAAPDEAEIARRRQAYHAPYHAALRAELDRVKARHGHAILFDCHSIRSCIPFLFSGTLPDFNVGTDGGTTCAATVEAALCAVCDAAPGYSSVLNGRFRGGWTTRHYGRPPEGVHAVQMELAQSTYLVDEAPPWRVDRQKADRLRAHLREMLSRLAALKTEALA
jgi:formiminoglutamase